MGRRSKVALVILSILVGACVIFYSCAPQLGGRPNGDRLAIMEQSDHFKDGKFCNPVETTIQESFTGSLKSFWEFAFKGNNREPSHPLPFVKVDPQTIGKASPESLRVTWLGHSTVILEMDGQVILTDPMLGRRASPIPFAGPKQFNDEAPLNAEDFPDIKAIVISHDHYDHLDYGTIMALEGRTEMFFVPLGVGAHLEKWGISPEKITELDWWQGFELGSLRFTATPARHFSGRAGLDAYRTLWCSWVIEGSGHKVFFGGDSGYFDVFRTIGQKFGPFDLALVECGAYSPYWPYIHMMPEQTVQAHMDLGGKVLMPIHWGKFNLSLHPWNEPVERALAAARQNQVTVATPIMGEPFYPGESLPQTCWWREVPSNLAQIVVNAK
ncbi:MAG: MBL fold metallo-hydrolase [Desulfatibacillum sp.]|nr:MBL fold metallo-hydrolase [Desulfatibacillum sp.]